MRLETTFDRQKFVFENLCYICCETFDVIFETNLNNDFETYQFFKKISKIVKSEKAKKIYRKNEKHFQFGVRDKDEIIPIKWFDLMIENKVISHDIAFNTTIIERDSFKIPFGRFPMAYNNKKLPIYRELKIKSKAYRFIANQINFKGKK